MNISQYCIFLYLILFTSFTWGQNKKDAFLYIDDAPVYSDEFSRLYKKNLKTVSEESQKDLDNYLELFIDYQLKLKEAKALGLDKKESYIKDIKEYRDETTLQLLEDSELNAKIIEDMYNRSLKEVHASHILINLPNYAHGKDTVKAYEKINALRERAIAGEDFNELAQEYSDEPAAKNTKGDLGYFSSLQMVMPFEDAAFNTSVGEVSEVIRTGYGYHILKVHDERDREPKLRAAHIMLMKSKDTVADKDRIFKAYQALENGEDFSDVVKEYSQDKATIEKGGELKPFDRRTIRLKEFTDSAYNLKEGEYSEPFESDMGWHIVKLLERLPHPTKEETTQKIIEFFNSKAGVSYYDDKKYAKLLDALNYRLITEDYAQDFLELIDREYLLKNKPEVSLPEQDNKQLFSLGQEVYYYNDFLEYLGPKKQFGTAGMREDQILYTALENYKREQALHSYAKKMYKEDEEYAALIDEYNNGMLLFDLMKQEIWGKVAKDTIAQKEYFAKHKEQFALPERWKVVIYKVNDQSTAEAIQEKLNSNVEISEIDKEFNVTSNTEIWTKDNPRSQKLGENADLIKPNSDNGEYKLVKLIEYLSEGNSDFATSQNRVLQAYQNTYEEEWINSLRQKYKVKLKKNRWKKLKNKLR